MSRGILAVCEARGYEPETSLARYWFSILCCWFEPIEGGLHAVRRAREGLIAGADLVYAGHAGMDGPANAGWLLGHFMPAGDLRHSDQVEVKWGVHPCGSERAQWVTGEQRTAMIILVSGRFRVNMRDRTVLLAEQGDYVLFQGVDYSWRAEADSVVVGIRWPSIPGYAVRAGGGR